ncbi:MAG: pyroglutamyl-peptidase I [Tenericutes bacterium]|nr:pyroglutamyl-peptidase I [Mycoplasmatota bacterium]
MKIIVTGFGGFLDNDANPTKEILKMLPKKLKDKEIYPIELPVVFDECFNNLKPYIDSIKPDVIIMLGLAGGRMAITPERVAINMKDSHGPDNLGYIPKDEIIIPGAKEAYFSSLPLRKIEQILLDNNLAVSISNSAGLYVCNNIMYHVLHYIDQSNLNCQAGFIHVPFSDETLPKPNTFSMPLNDIYQAVINIIEFAF